MLKETYFLELTQAQMNRDEGILEDIRTRFIAPLIADLEKAIPHYLALKEPERFIALMRLNDDANQRGDRLSVDFGCYFEGEKLASVFEGVFFSGVEGYSGHIYGDPNMPMVYVPRFSEGHFRGYVTLHGQKYESICEYPLPFRIAIIAHHLTAVLVCPLESACRFAAGWDDSLFTGRICIEELSAGEKFVPDEDDEEIGITINASHGWKITIRDTSPKNELMLDICRYIRSVVNESQDGQQSMDDDRYYCPSFTEQSPELRHTRAQHQSTECLTDFLFRFLPERGLHVGRKGKGEKLGWDDAYQLFTAEYGDYYTSVDSFQKRCYAHLKARKEG